MAGSSVNQNPPNDALNDAAQAVEIEPIAPADARRAIEAAIAQQLGPNWDDEDTGWAIVHDTDYLVRLTRGRVNLDFHCDLLGAVSVTEREINPVQASGKLIAWMVLIASLALAFLLASLAGVFAR